MFRTFKTMLAGRTLVLETGKLCCLPNGSCIIRYGDPAVLVKATA